MLENRAFLKIDKFELMFENVMKEYPREIQSTPSNRDMSFSRSFSPFQVQNQTQMNNFSNLITPPPKTNNVNTQGIAAAADDDDSESLWDYVDDLLKAESQSSNKQPFVFNETLNNEPEPCYGGPKDTPKKEDLMTDRKINYCTLDLEEEDEIEALLMQKKRKSEENSREYNMLAIIEPAPQRPRSPMVIEQQRPFINILAAPDPDVIVPESMPPQQESPRMNSTRIEIEEQKTPIERRISQQHLSQSHSQQRLNQNEEHKTPIERRMSQQQQHFTQSQRLSLNQNQSQNLPVYKAFSQHSLQKMNPSPTVSKVKQLQQLIEDKRVESAKNSAVKTPPRQQTRETRDCSICLCEIEESGKIDSCTHQFCFTCILDWSKITNQCPLCKGRFDMIEKFSNDGSLLDTLPVVFKQQVYEDENLLQEEMDENCYECENGDDDAHLLVCDRCGFFCCHTYCCVPAFETVPLEDWYCKFCLPAIRRDQRRGQNNTTTGRRNNRANQGTGAGTRSRRNSRRPNNRRQNSLDNFVVEEERPRTRNRNEIEEEAPRTNNNRSNRNRRNNSNRTVITIIEDSDDVPIAPRNMSRNQRRLVV